MILIPFLRNLKPNLRFNFVGYKFELDVFILILLSVEEKEPKINSYWGKPYVQVKTIWKLLEQ